jgi:hypothetical protein
VRGKTSRQWRWVLIYAVTLAFITLIPYSVGWLRAGEDWTFNGFTFGVDDGNAYLGKMRIGAEGDWRFHLFYTPEEHEPVFGLYLPHILMGHLVRFIANPIPSELVDKLTIAFQLWRIVASILLVLAIYRFVSVFFRSIGTRWFALLLITLGGGLGWILILIGQTDFLGTLPVEFYIPEGFSFLVLDGLPHIAMGRAALLIGLVSLFTALHKQDWRYALLSGLCWNIVGLMVTFYLAVLYVILAVWGLALWLCWRRFPLTYAWMGGFAAALTLPQFLYNTWLFSSNGAFAQWSRQNYLPSPHPLHYLIAYGVLAGFALIGGCWAWQRAARPQGEPFALLVGWTVVTPVLVYLPLNVQRRLSEAVLVPLVILAVAGTKLSAGRLWSKVSSLRRSYQRTRRFVLVALLPSTLLFWLGTVFILLTPDCALNACLYRPTEERAALDWLQQHAEENAVVLSSFRTGNFLPVDTDLRPVYGHGPETLHSGEKETWVEHFYQGILSDEERQRGLKNWHVRYVWFGPLEKSIGDQPLAWNKGMSLVYDRNGYMIFEVGE